MSVQEPFDQKITESDCTQLDLEIVEDKECLSQFQAQTLMTKVKEC